MKLTSQKLVNTCEYEVEDGTSLKFFLRHKPHRKTVSGLRLLTDSCKTVRSSSEDSKSKTKVSEEDARKQLGELPYDLLMHQIFARLPIKSLLSSKSVSKEWYSALSSAEFANVHFRTHFSSFRFSSPIDCLFIQAANSYYLFYLEEEEIVLDYCLVKLEPNFDYNNQNELCLVGSCNGLVCLSDYDTGCFYIWNPIVYHCQKFSDPWFSSYNYLTSWGFAYISSADDYKVVRISENYDTRETIVLVFSLKTKVWKQIHDHGLDDRFSRFSLTKTKPGVLANDTLYWILETKGVAKKHVVVGFNLILEKFEEISGLSSINIHDHFLCVMGGCLSLCSLKMHKEACVSIMKQPGKAESVSLSSCSKSGACSSLVGFTKTGKALMVSKSWELALVDVNASPIQYFPLVTFKDARKPCMAQLYQQRSHKMTRATERYLLNAVQFNNLAGVWLVTENHICRQHYSLSTLLLEQ